MSKHQYITISIYQGSNAPSIHKTTYHDIPLPIYQYKAMNTYEYISAPRFRYINMSMHKRFAIQ